MVLAARNIYSGVLVSIAVVTGLAFFMTNQSN
ncbi:hypothetical protein AAUPMC_05472, partial [Pasteurella multocida subsp. multocida str. Anand1_cattle]